MASDRQIKANRENAQKCTGPRTEAGKARSSQNALKTGLDAKSEVIRYEKQSDYDTLTTEYYDRFHPTVPEERCLVDTLIKSEWLGRRYMAIEANLWTFEITDDYPHPLGRAFAIASEQFARVDRRINSAQRNFQQALKQLRQIQADHPQDVTAPEPDEPAESAPPLPFIVPNPPAPIPDTATEQLNTELDSIGISLQPASPASPKPAEQTPDPDANGTQTSSADDQPPIEAPNKPS